METISSPRDARSGIPAVALGAMAITITVVLVVPADMLGIAAFVCCGALAAFWLLAEGIGGNVAPLTVCWVALFPLGYAFLSFPSARPLITFDRCFVTVMLIAAVLARPSRAMRIPAPLIRPATAWAVFVAAATISLMSVSDVVASARVLVDGFVLPALFAFAALRLLEVRRCVGGLHIATCVMCIYSAAIGVAELATGRDLIALPGAGFYLDTGIGIPRPNGPFLTNHSFALIGLTAFFLLRFLRRLQPDAGIWGRALHAAGVISALLMAMLPLFRSVMLTLFAAAVVGAIRGQQRTRKLAAVALVAAIALYAMSLVPELLETRISSDRNVGARWAQQQQNLTVFWGHPLLGVGFGNFHAAVSDDSGFSAFDSAFDPLDHPHSNLGAVLAETGLAGFIPYVGGHLLLAIAFWRTRTNTAPEALLARRCFAAVFASYWITGLTLASGYYGDLNLWYMLTVVVLYKIAAMAPQNTRA